MDTKLIWLAKRLKDIAVDIEKLSEDEKKAVIEKCEEFSHTATTELYNALLEYMQFDFGHLAD